jgi:pSer/pThr/pTyr-binding forkhead associated (FHA) protein
LSDDVILLALRVAAGVLLLAFLVALFVILWRDYRMAASVITEGKRQRGRLVVLRSRDGAAAVGTSYPLLPVTSMGRGAQNTIVLEDSFASQEHALVTWRGGQWLLEDRNSSNGTTLNDEPVREPVVISSGDVIGIGQILLKLELE